MSHQEKQRIFNQLSQNIDPETIRQGMIPLNHFEDFEDVLLAFRYSNISLQSLTKIIFEACDIVQAEQQERIADNATIDGSEYSRCGCVINEDSIINPENKIQ